MWTEQEPSPPPKKTPYFMGLSQIKCYVIVKYKKGTKKPCVMKENASK